jgi:hypothetical protein
MGFPFDFCGIFWGFPGFFLVLLWNLYMISMIIFWIFSGVLNIYL